MPLDNHNDRDGRTWKLGYTYPPSDRAMMRASQSNIRSKIPRVLTEADFRAIDYCSRSAGYPESLFEDQNGYGSCTCAAATGAGSFIQFMRTGKIIKRSWPWLYDQINGGHDNGSNIIDSMMVLQDQGAPPFVSYPDCTFDEGRDPSGVPWYKEDVPVTVTDALDCFMGLSVGGLSEVPILVDNDFEKFTSEGVAWKGKAPSGSGSNHAVICAGWHRLANGEWVWMLLNSWSKTWGPFKQGWCYAPLDAINNPAMTNDGYVHLSTVDPTDPTKPAPIETQGVPQ
jgi:hypothetical protein